MKKIRLHSILLLIYVIFNTLSVAHAQDNYDDPKYLKLLDLAKCQMKVTEIENSSSINSTKGESITPSRRDTELKLVKLEGVAYDYGRLSYNPALFGVNYINKGSLKFVPARAIGFKGETQDGKKYERWESESEESFNIIVLSEGELVNIWIAVEVPKDVIEFYIRIPTNLSKPIKLNDD